MTRKFALEPAQAGLMIGVVTLAGDIVGALAGGAMSDRWSSHGTPGGRLRALLPCSLGTAIAVPCFSVAPTANPAAAGYFLFIHSNDFTYVRMYAAVPDMVPPPLRRRIPSLLSL